MNDALTLTTDWRLPASIEEVAAILSEPERLPDWWPEVYLSARVIDPGGPDGLGRTLAFRTRGFLPYTLDWQARITESRRPHGWTIEATGDLAGRGAWQLEQQGEIAAIHYDWRVAVERPLLKTLLPILRPVYAANHRWAMARGREGLAHELARRRG